METRFLSSSPKPTVPFVLSYKTPLLQTLNHSAKTHFSDSQFLGKSVVFEAKTTISRNRTEPRFGAIRAFVKRRKELPLDNVIERDKKLKLVLKIRKIFLQQPNRIMTLRHLGRFRTEMGLSKLRELIDLLRKFPSVFEIVEANPSPLRFKLTAEAERLYFREMKVRNAMEDSLVTKLRKLLMMSMERRILLKKISHLRDDFGLPSEFHNTICHRYPHYFRVVSTEQGPALELTHWDPKIAISTAEKNPFRGIEHRDLIIERPLKFNRVILPKGLAVSQKEMSRLRRFHDSPLVSPYSDFSGLKPGTMEKEKHTCAVVHEILSLTTEKRMLLEIFTHFRDEFRFTQRLRGTLIRHPEMFYVSLKGVKNSVFLREAYRGSELIDKDALRVVKDEFCALVNGRFRRVDEIKQEGGELVDDEALGFGEEWCFDDLLKGDNLSEDNEDDTSNGVMLGRWDEKEVVEPVLMEERARVRW